MDNLERILVVAIGLVLAAGVAGLGYQVWLDAAHPCTQRVNCHPETYYVQSGSVLVPFTHTVCDCAAREP